MNKIIKVDTDFVVTVHDFPHGGDVMGAMKELIGNGCRSIEHVMPKRLYSELGHSNTVDREGRCVSMLIDEEGALKENKLVNPLASHLYETDKHGCPIYGNVLFVADVYEGYGISFAGIEPETCDVLYAQLEELAPKMIKALLFMLHIKRKRENENGRIKEEYREDEDEGFDGVSETV